MGADAREVAAATMAHNVTVPRIFDASPTMGPAATVCQEQSTRELTRDILRTIGDKWSLVVVSYLAEEPKRFTRLLQDLGPISHRLLTKTLRDLERDGIVARLAYREVPPRVEYSLTALGKGLLEPLAGLIEWIAQNESEVQLSRQVFDAKR